MDKHNLGELFKLINLDMQMKPNVLSIQIVYLYYIIKEWYIHDNIKNITSINQELIDTTDRLNDIFYKINGTYISLVYPQSAEQINDNDKSCINSIEQSKLESIGIYAVYICTDKNIFIILIYNYHQKVLLIDVNTRNIVEFTNSIECINYVDAINSKYTYQLLKVVNRLFS
jgi:hypothetical protein